MKLGSKWIASALMTVIGVTTLSGCGSTTATSASGNGGTTASSNSSGGSTASNSSTTSSEKGFKIALSNASASDSWRQQMMQIANAYAQKKETTGEITKFYETSSGDNPQDQINQIRNLIAQGYDAILVDASSPSALIPVLTQAVQKGIVVVAFDNTVSSDQVYNVNTDQVQFGKDQATWLVKQIGGKGNILEIDGINGISINADRAKGYQEVLANYPDIKVLEKGFGGYNEAQTSQVITSQLSAIGNQKISGILTQGGGEAAVDTALKQHNLDPSSIPMTGEMMNGFFRIMEQDKVNGFAVGQPPYLSASALDVALGVLEGKQEPKNTVVPLPEATSQDADKWYVSGQSDDFYVDWTDPQNSFNLQLSDVLKK